MEKSMRRKTISQLLIMLLGIAIVTVSCNKEKVTTTPNEAYPQLSTSSETPPIVQSFTGNMETMILNPDDAEDEKVNKGAQSILLALTPMLNDVNTRTAILDLADDVEWEWVSLEDLMSQGIISQVDLYSAIQNSPYYIGSSVEDWLESSFFYTVQHFPVINIPNLQNCDYSNDEYFLSLGEESNADFTDDDNGLVHVYHYQNGSLLGEKVINEEYALSTSIPMFVVSPSVDPYNPPSIPGYTTTVTSGEDGDGSLYPGSSYFNKTSSYEKRPIVIYEQRIDKRFERWGSSEIASAGIWNVKTSVPPPYTPYARHNYKKSHGMWTMKKKDVGKWHYKWNSLNVNGEWLVDFNENMTWNSYERDWSKSAQKLCSVYNLSNQNDVKAYGERKYFSEVYAYGPTNNGPTNTYNLNQHPHLWATVWVTGPNGKFRVWRVQ